VAAREAHLVQTAASCGHATQMIDSAPFDVAVLDVTLPDGSGIEMPILLLTARGDGAQRTNSKLLAPPPP
jgi:DNA-binding response OmpR family regulator